MRVRIPELALKRHAERFDPGLLRISGSRLLLLATQTLPGLDGEPTSVATVCLEGQRLFGGAVEFDSDTPVRVLDREPPTPGIAEGAGKRLLHSVVELCLCGNWRHDCDCCPACASTGRDATNAACAECAGKGYQPRPG